MMVEAQISSWVEEREGQTEQRHLKAAFDFRGRSFTAVDVSEFLSSDLDDLERCDLADDHPFRNPWHCGSWRDEARLILAAASVTGGDYDYIGPDERERFLDAVDILQDYRGYGDGVGEGPEDVDPDLEPDFDQDD